jgi:hypothetical protein
MDPLFSWVTFDVLAIGLPSHRLFGWLWQVVGFTLLLYPGSADSGPQPAGQWRDRGSGPRSCGARALATDRPSPLAR